MGNVPGWGSIGEVAVNTAPAGQACVIELPVMGPLGQISLRCITASYKDTPVNGKIVITGCRNVNGNPVTFQWHVPAAGREQHTFPDRGLVGAEGGNVKIRMTDGGTDKFLNVMYGPSIVG